MHYTSHRTVLPEHNARYENGDTLTLGDGTEWEYFEASGWVPVAVRPVTNPVTGGIRYPSSYIESPELTSGLVAAICRMFSSVAQVKVFTYGDSVSKYISDEFVSGLANATFQTGFGGVGTYGLAVAYGGGASSVLDRFDASVTGQADRLLSSGDYALYSVGGGVRVINKAAVWLATGPAAGAVKVEIVANDGSTVLYTVTASQSLASQIPGFMRLGYAGASFTGKLKVTSLGGGTVDVLMQYISRDDISGTQYISYSRGGITASQPGPAAWGCMYDVISYYAPNAVFWTGRESVDLIDNYDGPLVLSKYRELLPRATLIICGVWAVTSETAFSTSNPSYLENESLRKWSNRVGATFIDAYSMFPTYHSILDVDPSYDGVHIGKPVRFALLNALYSETGLSAIYGARSFADVQNSLTRSGAVAVTGDTSAQDALKMVAVESAFDVLFGIRRDAIFQDQSRAAPAPLTLRAGANRYGAMFNTLRSVAETAGNYASDGQFSLSLNGSTGELRVYGRVGGVLKSLVVGTLV